jgi:hypothetical protein
MEEQERSAGPSAQEFPSAEEYSWLGALVVPHPDPPKKFEVSIISEFRNWSRSSLCKPGRSATKLCFINSGGKMTLQSSITSWTWRSKKGQLDHPRKNFPLAMNILPRLEILARMVQLTFLAPPCSWCYWRLQGSWLGALVADLPGLQRDDLDQFLNSDMIDTSNFLDLRQYHQST